MSTEIRIVGASVVPHPGAVLAHAEIALSPSSGLITYLGPIRGPAGPVDVDARDRIVAPGLVNAHTHAAMTLLRGHSDDVPLREWLTAIRAFELRMTFEDIRAGLGLAMVEMIRSGTIGFVDMHLWDGTLLADVCAAGMRVRAAPAVFGYDAVAYPGATPETGAQVLDRTPDLAAEFAGEDLVRVSYGPHAPYSCGPGLLGDVASRAAVNGLGVHIHLSETRAEVDESIDRHGISPIALAGRLGLFALRTHVAHAVHPRPGDHQLLAAPGITVSHNPISNLKLGAGIAPIADYRTAGVALALGSDSVASNNAADLFQEIKIGTLLQRGAHHDPGVQSGLEALAMATSGGAAALADRLPGRLGVGEPADLVMVDTTAPSATPMTDPRSFLAFAATGADVTDVFIAGRRVLEDRRLTTLDEQAIRADVGERVRRIRTELGLPLFG